MPARVQILAGALCASVCAEASAQPQGRRAPLSLNAAQAAEVLLRDVCLPGVIGRQPIGDLAARERAIPLPAKAYGGGPADKAYRLGPIGTPVYAVDWADGSCSTRVANGDAAALGALAESLILARPEGFVRAGSGPLDGGRVTRTVYCATDGAGRLIASVTTAGEKSNRGTTALSSTVLHTSGPTSECPAL